MNPRGKYDVRMDDNQATALSTAFKHGRILEKSGVSTG